MTILQSNLSPLLGYAFRPFFLLTAFYACLSVMGWMGFLFAGWPIESKWLPFYWHSHEMIYGTVTAAIAGFLLTAVTNWTGAPPLRGWGLLGMILLWVSGRIAIWFSFSVPSVWVAIIDLAFLPVLATYLAVILLRYNNRKNLVLVLILALLFTGNLLMHLGVIRESSLLLHKGEHLGFNLIVLLMALISGRITPAFSANWLRSHGQDPDQVIRSVWIDRIALGSIALLIPLDMLAVPNEVSHWVILIAAIANTTRLLLWKGWRVRKEPLLWILHLGYFWIALGLCVRWGLLHQNTLPSSLWIHTLGVGAMGTLLLGVMTRVAMGHTGRPLKLVRFGLWIYLLIFLSTILRLGVASGSVHYSGGMLFAAFSWVLAFGLFFVLYWNILSRPRADGRPG
ncbi:NnrS family protein [Nitrincola tibetensis]|uniref:NnrS family protein n=1 Tax=Nitrincola tibetensis TaxID=2219697 RepID=A0A364NRC5_9GAMM|nr:NnrS family protein [Nitrincola tibetensis]RAU19636.1 NnrS family protein [Nitrincola tibetensis]